MEWLLCLWADLNAINDTDIKIKKYCQSILLPSRQNKLRPNIRNRITSSTPISLGCPTRISILLVVSRYSNHVIIFFLKQTPDKVCHLQQVRASRRNVNPPVPNSREKYCGLGILPHTGACFCIDSPILYIFVLLQLKVFAQVYFSSVQRK